MKKRFRLFAIVILSALLSGCVATAPIKVASKGAKLGVKASKTTVKAGAAIIPDGETKEEQN